MTGWDFKSVDGDPETVVDLVLRKPFDQEGVEQVMAAAVQLLARSASHP